MNANGSQRQLIVQADASNLKVDVERTLQALAISADAAEQNVATLAALDQGKSNMEQACSTLKVCHHSALCVTAAASWSADLVLSPHQSSPDSLLAIEAWMMCPVQWAC